MNDNQYSVLLLADSCKAVPLPQSIHTATLASLVCQEFLIYSPSKTTIKIIVYGRRALEYAVNVRFEAWRSVLHNTAMSCRKYK